MKNLILTTAVLLLLCGCYSKYDDTRASVTLQVPPYTETGAQTFGCLVNGKVWANFGATIIHPAEGIGSRADTNKVRVTIQWPEQGISNDTAFSVSATYSLIKKGKTERQEYMSFTIPKNGSLVGTYRLGDSARVFRYQPGVLYPGYSSNARNPFVLMINKDSPVQGGSYHIVSGRFYGTLYNYELTDSVNIAAGVFDVKTGD
ncbi:MAG TPA: hypothetical protein VG367_12765 [Mucilaginibacter sp.]|jgi:hypothetical protein|nr:hypothetical protein [Mucilaginibacter sp.]